MHSGGFQERQSIIKYWLDNLRAKQGEVLHNIHFLEGQPISMLSFITTELYTVFSHLYKIQYFVEFIYKGPFVRLGVVKCFR